MFVRSKVLQHRTPGDLPPRIQARPTSTASDVLARQAVPNTSLSRRYKGRQTRYAVVDRRSGGSGGGGGGERLASDFGQEVLLLLRGLVRR